MIEELLNKISRQDGYTYFPPSEKTYIDQTNNFLTNNNFAKLPQDYTDFLHLCDGFIFDGLELYGVQKHNRTAKKYTFSSISDVNEPFILYEYFKYKTIIGTSAENFIFYNQKDNLYLITDKINLCTYVEFLTFEDLLSAFIQIFDLDN